MPGGLGHLVVRHGPGVPVDARLVGVLEVRSSSRWNGARHRVTSLDELPSAGAVLLDLTPRQVLSIAGGRTWTQIRQASAGATGTGGVFKAVGVDGPIPWSSQRSRGTVHLGGTMAEVAAAEDDVARGRHPSRPFVLLAQQSLFDPSRAPSGVETAWAYCHVRNRSTLDMTSASRHRSSGSPPGSATASSPGTRRRPRQQSVTTPTTSEGTSAVVRRSSTSSGATVPGRTDGRCCGPVPPVLDTARRGEARPVWLACCDEVSDALHR